jgi:uncharacterized membrane protein YhaH (DUF805 family)
MCRARDFVVSIVAARRARRWSARRVRHIIERRRGPARGGSGMTIFRWPVGRAGRGAMLNWLVLGSIGFIILDWFAFRRLNPMINLGYRFDAIDGAGVAPAWRVALDIAFNIGLTFVAVARLHDIGRSGWWLAGLAALGVVGVLGGAPALALPIVLGWIALLFWRGETGPNRYGPDPYGWTSREHYETQMRALADEARRGR